MYRLQIIGNLGNDAEVKQLTSGAIAISFSIAYTKKYQQQGQPVEQTFWVGCTRWVQPGGSTKLADYLKKGTKVLVEGEPSARAWVDSAGEAHAAIQLRVDNLEFLGNNQGGGNNQQQAAPPSVQAVPKQQPHQAHKPQSPPASGFPTETDDLPF